MGSDQGPQSGTVAIQGTDIWSLLEAAGWSAQAEFPAHSGDPPTQVWPQKVASQTTGSAPTPQPPKRRSLETASQRPSSSMAGRRRAGPKQTSVGWRARNVRAQMTSSSAASTRVVLIPWVAGFPAVDQKPALFKRRAPGCFADLETSCFRYLGPGRLRLLRRRDFTGLVQAVMG